MLSTSSASALMSIFSEFAIEAQKHKTVASAASAFLLSTDQVREYLKNRSLPEHDKLLALQTMRALCDLWMTRSSYVETHYWASLDSDKNRELSAPNHGNPFPSTISNDSGKAWQVCVETLVNDKLREGKPYFNYRFDFLWEKAYAANLSFGDAAKACEQKMRNEFFTY